MNRNDIITQVRTELDEHGQGDGFGTIWREKTPFEKLQDRLRQSGEPFNGTEEELLIASKLLGIIR